MQAEDYKTKEFTALQTSQHWGFVYGSISCRGLKSDVTNLVSHYTNSCSSLLDVSARGGRWSSSISNGFTVQLDHLIIISVYKKTLLVFIQELITSFESSLLIFTDDVSNETNDVLILLFYHLFRGIILGLNLVEPADHYFHHLCSFFRYLVESMELFDQTVYTRSNVLELSFNVKQFFYTILIDFELSNSLSPLNGLLTRSAPFPSECTMK